MAKALGQTPEEATAPGIDGLPKYLTGNVGLVLTNRPVEAVLEYFNNMSLVDFARAGTVASRTFAIPTGVVHATGGEVPAENDIPLAHTLEPELRRLGVPTRMVKGKVVLGDESGEGEPYVVCKDGDVLDSRQTRLLKMFDVCLSEFKVRVVAYVSPLPTDPVNFRY
jgi:mRNA turnover protein 4